jgi:pyridoxal phosphate enzyme (YggS family)
MCGGIADNLKAVRGRIAEAAAKSGRDVGDITLVAVSKTVGPPDMALAYEAGILDFGENRAQELRWKSRDFPEPCRWHFIGRLQTNKVKDVVGRAALIHSLDRAELADKIEHRAAETGAAADVLIQVNISGEPAKAGLSPDEVPGFLDSLAGRGVNVMGMMTVAPYTRLPEETRRYFAGIYQLARRMEERFAGAENITMRYLSMGMSNDYAVAVEEGANIVRIGTAIFGARQQPPPGGER